jgi:putative transposase
MLWFLTAIFQWLASFIQSRHDLGLEIIALRHQVSVLKRRNKRPRLKPADRFFWVILRRLWANWSTPLLIVKPETVVGWHRKGFRLYWRFLSRCHRPGRPKIDADIRAIIHRMAEENPTWGAPRIHGELLKLGCDVSERTVSRYLGGNNRTGDAGQRWRVFLDNHREAIAELDFLTVTTANFRILYCLFVISHSRREILHCNATHHPTGEWIVQQLREAFPDTSETKYLIFDRDAKFGAAIPDFAKASSMEVVRTSYRSPWQNGVAERWIRSFRNELLDHVIIFNEAHLKRLTKDYLRYYHEDRTHDGLAKDAPAKRAMQVRKAGDTLVSLPRIGGLHHRYRWEQAA